MVTCSGIGRRSLDRLSWHETAHHHQAPPCKQRPPRPVGIDIYPFGMVWLSFSPFSTDFAYRLLCLAREEPNDTPLELVAELLVLLLPLLFTLQ